jgi:hypothetical protein
MVVTSEVPVGGALDWVLVATSWMHYFVYLRLAQTFLGAQLARARGSSKVELTGLGTLWGASVVFSSLMFSLHAGGSHRYELSRICSGPTSRSSRAHRLFWRSRGRAT